jgi:hypothetical protein
MSTENKPPVDPDAPTIYVNYFDRNGYGPTTLRVSLYTFAPMGIYERPTLGLQFKAQGLSVIESPAGGGMHFGPRENVVELHRQLGAWLEANP